MQLSERLNIDEYQELAKRTCADLGPDQNRQHMILGVISEVGEIADAYKKTLAYGKPFDIVNRNEEAGDVFWYIANYATQRNKKLEMLKMEYQEFLEYDGSNYSSVASDYLFDFVKDMTFADPQKLFNQWYSTCLNLGMSDGDIERSLATNIRKLYIRYPDKFDADLAQNRNLELERQELEK